MFVYGKYERYIDGDTEWVGWTTDRQTALTVASALAERDVVGVLMPLHPNGTIGERELFHAKPKPYTGPIERARVCMTSKDPGSFHRLPIDCLRPNGPWEDDINEWFEFRIVATSEHPSYDHYINSRKPTDEGYWSCRCGEWQDIEGTPEKVAELVAKYPYSPSTT